MTYSWHFPIRAISKDNEKIFNRQGRPFLSKKFKDFEETLRMYYIQKPLKITKPLESDLEVNIWFYFKNKKHSDLMNLPKSICDAFNGLIWKDDRQIKNVNLAVYYGNSDSIELEVREL